MNDNKTTLGLLVGSRGFFPEALVREGRTRMLNVLKAAGLETVALDTETTKNGAVETFDDASKWAELISRRRSEIDGLLVTLPNFGDEKGVANALRGAELDVPVLIHAFPDNPDSMGLDSRRDSFCGKLSVCNNLVQYGIPFSLTRSHTVDPGSPEFAEDLAAFAAVCRVVKGLGSARVGAIGARTGPFNTVRFSEKILEDSGISVETVDLSEMMGRANSLNDDDPNVKKKVAEIKDYADTSAIPENVLPRIARMSLVIEDWVAENNLSATAIQCWTAMEQYYGIVPCSLMSMMSNRLLPSACEVDVPGALAMLALSLATGKPSALADWNNNYGTDPDKAVLFHCSNWPKEMFDSYRLGGQDIIGANVGVENAYGTVIGRMKPGPLTYARLSTDDRYGVIRGYVGEGTVTNDPLGTFGGSGVFHVPGMQELMRYACRMGFEHHVAVSQGTVARALDEAFETYLGWETHWHGGE